MGKNFKPHLVWIWDQIRVWILGLAIKSGFGTMFLVLIGSRSSNGKRVWIQVQCEFGRIQLVSNPMHKRHCWKPF